MQRLRQRKWMIKVALLIAACFVFVYLQQGVFDPLVSANFYTGWSMVFVFGLLMLFGVRKKLKFLPLGKMTTWTQWHIYLGFLIAFLFLLHIDFSIPEGGFEQFLGALFFFDIVTGMWGLYITKSLPFRLSTRGEPLIFEQIPAHLDQLQHRVQEIILDVTKATKSNNLSDFYQSQLLSFLEDTSDYWLHIGNSTKPRMVWDSRFKSLHRYLSEEEQKAMDEIREITLAKIDLDYQYAAQHLLKVWLFIHIPLSLALIPAILIHIVLVYSYMGSVL